MLQRRRVGTERALYVGASGPEIDHHPCEISNFKRVLSNGLANQRIAASPARFPSVRSAVHNYQRGVHGAHVPSHAMAPVKRASQVAGRLKREKKRARHHRAIKAHKRRGIDDARDIE